MHQSLETLAPMGPGIMGLNCHVLLAMKVLHLPVRILAGLLAELYHKNVPAVLGIYPSFAKRKVNIPPTPPSRGTRGYK